MDVQQVANSIAKARAEIQSWDDPDLDYLKTPTRVFLWEEFSEQVDSHIIDYVVPQWKDFPDDPYNTSTIEQLQHNLQRYVARINSSVRGEEDSLRDLLKIAHVASVIWEKKTGLQEALMKEIKNGRIQSDV